MKTKSTDYSLLRIEYRDDLCWVTVNREKDRNSINTALMEELDQALTEAEATPARAVVITGAGDTYFIGGADGIEMMQCDPDEAADFSSRIQNVFNRMETSPLPLVAAINGLCFGGGYELALACDFRIAADRARIGLPEVKVGLIPGGGGTQRLPRVVGMGRALEMILSGRLYSAKEAWEMNLIQRCAGGPTSGGNSPVSGTHTEKSRLCPDPGQKGRSGFPGPPPFGRTARGNRGLPEML